MKKFFNKARGNILILVIVLGGASLLAILGLVSYAVSENRASQYKHNREQALQIAEAGIAYYRWHLAHNKSDFQDGTGQPGPYIHDYFDKDGKLIGYYSLIVDAPTNGSTIVTLYSTGWLVGQPDSKRTLKVRLGFPAISDYSFLVDSDIVFSSTAYVHGKTHSNGVVIFNGVSDAPISSALEITGTGGPKSYWLYPVPKIDLTSIQLKLDNVKTEAQKNGLNWPYLPASGGYGYQLTFKDNGTVDVQKVLTEPTCYSGACYDATSFGTVTNYDVPTSSYIFVDDMVWLKGVVKGRVTLATIGYDIVINGNLTYLAKDGTNTLGIMTDQNIVFPYNVPDPMEVNAALATVNGTIFRPKYTGAKDIISAQNFYGSRVSSLPGVMKYMGCGTICSGFLNTSYIYDANLTYRPPAGFPVGSVYNLISWEEVRTTTAEEFIPVLSLTITPSSVSIPADSSQQFTATALPSNATVKNITWTVLGTSEKGTVTANGLYTAPHFAGTYTLLANSGGVTAVATIDVTSQGNEPPVISSALANPAIVTGSMGQLSVVATDDKGEPNLTYHWSIISKPVGAPDPVFSLNNSNAAKTTNVTFSRAGSYQFQATVTDQNSLSVNSLIIPITVSQTLSAIAISPPAASVATDTTRQFTATSTDQFSQPMAGVITYTWSVNNGSVNASGLYTPPVSTGVATIQASASGVTATGAITIALPAAAPTIAATYVNHGTTNPVVVGPYSVNANQMLIALAASDKNSGSQSNFYVNHASASGGSVTWTLVGTKAYNSGRGAVAIYVGKPGGNLTNVYTNIYSGNATSRYLRIYVIDGASPTLGNFNKANGLNNNPSVNLSASDVKSIMFAVGYDMAYSGAATTFTQTLADTWIPTGEMAWVQRSTNPTAGVGDILNFSRTAPVAGGWEMAAVEVKSPGVGGNPPTITTPASASPSTVIGTTSTLSVLATDDGGENTLTYIWSTLTKPSGAPDPTFSINSTNASKNTLATFYQSGSYQLQVTVLDSNGKATVSPPVSITVNSTLTTISVLPSPISLIAGGSPQQFLATSTDQFGIGVLPIPTYTWTASAGTVNSTGLYYPPAQVGAVTVNATSNGVTGIGEITVSSTASGGPNCTSGMCIAVCGDGVIEPPEQCDDGNTTSGDGCSATCNWETITGITCSNVTSTAPDTITMPVTYRDFKGYNETNGHPDFERYGCWTVSAGLVQNQLVNGKPVYARASDPSTGCGTQLTGANYLAQWYTDTSTNRTVNGSLTLNKISANPLTYQYDSITSPLGSPTGGTGFFPLDLIGTPATFGITPGQTHDFGFTTEVHYWFTYEGGETLAFSGDDDVWVFINGKLALDLGGLHPRVGYPSDPVGLLTLNDTKAAQLGLQKGYAYDMALFNAERHTSESNFKLTIGGFVKASTVCTSYCGDGQKAPSEECDLGIDTAQPDYNGKPGGQCSATCKLTSQQQL